MPLPPDCFDAVAAARDPSRGSLVTPWPMPRNMGGQASVPTFAEWRSFVLELIPRRTIPEIVLRKFERAQKLHVLAWLDFDLIKAGELVGMTALELARTDRYAHAEKQRRRKLVARKAETKDREISKGEKSWAERDLLKHMVESDGLTEEQVPMNMRCGSPSKVIDRLTGEAKPSLSDLRNDSAHGAPFDGFPQSGLLELVRDLIDYAYRDWPSVVEMAVIARLTRSRVRSRRISRNVRERHTQPAFAGSAAASGSARPSYEQSASSTAGAIRARLNAICRSMAIGRSDAVKRQ
jgi:hypothetical protein